jgi:arylformamidase
MPKLYREFTTQAAIDAEYNAAQSVPDYAACGRHYAETSAEARRTLPCSLDIPYGPTLDETLDIFPAERPGAPVFIFLHGGYWRALTSKEFSFVATGLRQLGITTVAPRCRSTRSRGRYAPPAHGCGRTLRVTAAIRPASLSVGTRLVAT